MKAENIFNLTQLWKLGGNKSGNFNQVEDVSISLGNEGDWPNKLWIDGEYRAEKLVLARNLAFDKKVSLATWIEPFPNHLISMSEYGFRETGELTGMSIDVQKINLSENRKGRLILVKNLNEAEKWSRLFFQSFGYQLTPSTLRKIQGEADFFIAEFQGEALGTAMIYTDEREVSGIYSLGVIPAFRRQGFANFLLESTLELIKIKGGKKTVLQASSMGLGMYLNHGFQEDFKIRFYQLT